MKGKEKEKGKVKEKRKKGMGKKSIGKEKKGIKRNGEKGEKRKEREEGMGEREWARKGSRDSKGRWGWGGGETRGRTGKGQGGEQQGQRRKRTHMGREWKRMGCVGKAWGLSPPLTQPSCISHPTPAQFHRLAASIPHRTRLHCLSATPAPTAPSGGISTLLIALHCRSGGKARF